MRRSRSGLVPFANGRNGDDSHGELHRGRVVTNVKNLDSSILTNVDVSGNCPNANTEDNKLTYVSAYVGVTARVSFRLNSPWRAMVAWIRKIAA
jgi:hypothetical protein